MWMLARYSVRIRLREGGPSGSVKSYCPPLAVDLDTQVIVAGLSYCQANATKTVLKLMSL